MTIIFLTFSINLKFFSPVVKKAMPPPPNVTFEKEVKTATLSRAPRLSAKTGIGVCVCVSSKS